MENRGVRPAADEAPVGRPLRTMTEELGLDFDLELAFGLAGAGRVQGEQVASGGGIGGRTHEVEFVGPLGPAQIGKLL